MELIIPKTAIKLNEDEMMYLDGGIAPVIIGGLIVAGVFGAGIGLGYWSTR